MVRFFEIRRAGLLAAVGLAALTLASCSDYVGKIPKHLAPLSPELRELVEKKGMDQKSPILIRIFKEESSLEVWKQQKATGRYALLKDFEICKWSGVLGPKLKEGDRQAPEGFYTIRPAQMNPNSSYHLSFNLGYPNEFDRAHGRTGSELMVHGACSSRGCYSMTDEQVQDIYTLGRLAFEAGQRDFQVQAFPFRMTAENMARHRGSPNMPFWRMLKEGYDHFEVVRQPPKVDVCEKRYVFNTTPEEGKVYNASSACPQLFMPEHIRVAVAKKDAKDNDVMMRLAGKLDRKDGSGAASVLAAALAAPTTASLAAPMSVATAPVSLEPATVTSITAAAPAAEPSTALAAEAPTGAAAEEGLADFAPELATAVPASPEPSPVADALANAAPAAGTLEPAEAIGFGLSTSSITKAAVPSPEPAAAETVAVPDAPLAPGSADTPTAIAEGADPALAPPLEAVAEATLEERMLAGSGAAQNAAGATPAAASAYAPDAEADGGLTGFVMQLFE